MLNFLSISWGVLIIFQLSIIFSSSTANQDIPENKVEYYLHKLEQDITNYNNYEIVTPWLHYLQTESKCCGLNGAHDYKNTWNVKPSSCCDETRNNATSIKICRESKMNKEVLDDNYYHSQGCVHIIKQKNSQPQQNGNVTEKIFDEYEYYRERFYDEMKYFDEDDKLSLWLDKIQSNNFCCGFNGPSDYKTFFKPPSCCDKTINDDEDLLKRCLHPPKDFEGVVGPSPHYYVQGCSKHLKKKIVDEIQNSNNVVVNDDVQQCDDLFSQFEFSRETFIQAINDFDKNKVLPSLLNNTQAQHKCCGYNGPRDYNSFTKPTSCRYLGDSVNKEELVETQNHGDNDAEAPQYYSQGCGRLVIRNIIQEYHQQLEKGKENLEKGNYSSTTTIMIIVFFFVSVTFIIFIVIIRTFTTCTSKPGLKPGLLSTTSKYRTSSECSTISTDDSTKTNC